MRLVIEPNDFSAESGFHTEALSDPMYGWFVRIVKRPGRDTWAMLSHRGSGYEVSAVTVEYAEPEKVQPKEPAPAAKSRPKKAKAKAAPAPAATLEKVASDWYTD